MPDISMYAAPTPPSCLHSSSNPPALSWFAVYTAPRHEKCVGKHFEARDIEFYLPLYRAVHRWKNGCKMTVNLPLFPSYIFAHIANRERACVLQVPGVVTMVGSGKEPVALSDVEIESLRAGLHLRDAEPYPYPKIGEHVRIKYGPLTGFEGILVRRKHYWRIVLTLDIIQQSVAVEVDITDIEPVVMAAHPKSS